MPIIKPTKITANIAIYSKWCVSCDYPDELNAVTDWAQKNGLSVQTIRTVYSPADHKKAMELWAAVNDLNMDNDDDLAAASQYPVFVVYKEVHTLKEFVKMIENEKDKMVKGGMTEYDLQRLSKAKKAKRKVRLGVANGEVKKKNEKKVEE